jgi:hypothetical protein
MLVVCRLVSETWKVIPIVRILPSGLGLAVGPSCGELAFAVMTASVAEIRRTLEGVEKQVEPIARNHPEGSDMSTLAHAIQDLVGCIDQLAAHVEAGGRGRHS